MDPETPYHNPVFLLCVNPTFFKSLFKYHKTICMCLLTAITEHTALKLGTIIIANSRACMKFLFWIFCLNCSLKEKKKPELGVTVHSCNISTREERARGSDYSQVRSECQLHRSAWAT